MAKKTDNEIKAEIQALKNCKPKVRKRNYFGDDLHEAINIQIRVLEQGLTEDEIYDQYSDPDNEDDRHGLDAALDALAWMNGDEREDAEHDSLAAGWIDIGLG